MNVSIKRISYKILIVSMITIMFSFFCASSVSQAKLKLKEGEFYYTGTQEGKYVVEASIWEKILASLAEVADYLLGIMTLGFRGVVVGWIEIMEILLTAILKVDIDIVQFFSDSIAGMDGYTQQIVNIEKIIFNEIPILNANIFKSITEADEK